jgi:hypothetical protein
MPHNNKIKQLYMAYKRSEENYSLKYNLIYYLKK